MATKRPPVGMKHLTVVPENFDGVGLAHPTTVPANLETDDETDES
jgi:hypothetical protein